MADFSNDEIIKRINRVSKENGHGDLTSSIYNTYFGINTRGTGSPVPMNNDQHGLTFFTRPNLNLSYDNIKSERILLPLLNYDEKSMFRAIRCLLDWEAEDVPGTKVKSNLIDPNNVFMSILTNNLLSISGWPDVVADTYTSKEGRAREAVSMVDGITENFAVTQISATFRNMVGDPITLLFFYWITYASMVYQGRITAKPESIVEREIDYMTRIYRLVLDPTRTYVRKIYACGAAFPVSAPIGASANFSIEKPFNQENDQITINFQMIGVQYLDPILVNEFNTAVNMFNMQMKVNGDITGHQLVSRDLANIFNHRAYPRINPYTFELQWYVPSDVYNEEMNIQSSLNAPTTDNFVIASSTPGLNQQLLDLSSSTV